MFLHVGGLCRYLWGCQRVVRRQCQQHESHTIGIRFSKCSICQFHTEFFYHPIHNLDLDRNDSICGSAGLLAVWRGNGVIIVEPRALYISSYERMVITRASCPTPEVNQPHPSIAVVHDEC